jgi:hypothetical protein
MGKSHSTVVTVAEWLKGHSAWHSARIVFGLELAEYYLARRVIGRRFSVISSFI